VAPRRSLERHDRDQGSGHRRAFPGNQIPLARISPIARAILTTRRSIRCRTDRQRRLRQLSSADATEDHAHQGDVRVDWNASSKDKIFGRFSFAEYESRNDKRAIRCCSAA
jgi:hypothetical protein